MVESIEALNSVELSTYLLRNGYGKEVASAFLQHKLCGCEFLEMTDTDLRDLLPCVGDRIRIRKLLNKIHSGRRANHHVVTTSHVHRSQSEACSMWPNNSATASSTSSRSSIGLLLQGVSERLVVVQNDRDRMQEMAKKEAYLEGQETSYLEWYDYSGCKKKYVQ